MDQIKMYKILNGHGNVDPDIFVKIKTLRRTRGHDFTLGKWQNRFDVRKYFFLRGPQLSEINCQLIACIISISICSKNVIHHYLVDSYMWTLDK